ncbi:MAG: hypothetical protein C0593_01790, partial [Marinilabiliales bacterium]
DIRKALLNGAEDLYNEIRITIFKEYFPYQKSKIFIKSVFGFEEFLIKHIAKPLKIAPRTWYKVSALLFSKFAKTE